MSPHRTHRSDANAEEMTPAEADLFEQWEQRVCPRCKVQKSITEFPRAGINKGQNRRRYGFCKLCHRAYQRASKLKRVFGLTLDEYDALFAAQSGICPICLRPPAAGGNRLSVDHNHKTGDVRGLLCWSCNRGLGFWREDVARMQRAIAYLSAEPFKAGSARFGRVDNKTKKKKRKKVA